MELRLMKYVPKVTVEYQDYVEDRLASDERREIYRYDGGYDRYEEGVYR